MELVLVVFLIIHFNFDVLAAKWAEVDLGALV
jgi:hypothetical protein